MRKPLPTAKHKPNHFIQEGKLNPPPAAIAFSDARAADADAIALDNVFIAAEAEEAAAAWDADAAMVVVAEAAGVAMTCVDIGESITCRVSALSLCAGVERMDGKVKVTWSTLYLSSSESCILCKTTACSRELYRSVRACV